MTDRVREVAFYRRPRTLFKGFRVPDWAQAQNFDGWDLDRYSRKAWDEAMHEFNSEWTPTQFAGERIEPNIIQWFRLEQWGKGSSARFFYNEVPKPRWDRHGGHLDNVDKHVYSFTHGDQPEPLVFGIDTTTEEGREAFKAEWDALAEMCPELMNKEDIVYPHEHKKYISDEAHFQRVWQHYREHVFRLSYAQLVDEGAISEEEATAFANFCDPDSPNINLFLLKDYGTAGAEDDAGVKAAQAVMQRLGLDQITINLDTAQPWEEQWWEQFDAIMELTEEEMREEVPFFVVDPRNKAQVEALLEGRAVEKETTAQLSA